MVAARIADMPPGARTDFSQKWDKLSQAQAAEIVNVSTRSVSNAKVVQERDAPELVAAVGGRGCMTPRIARCPTARTGGRKGGRARARIGNSTSARPSGGVWSSQQERGLFPHRRTPGGVGGLLGRGKAESTTAPRGAVQVP